MEADDLERLRSEIFGLTKVLHILKYQLPEPLSRMPPKKHNTVNDLLIHITNLLNTGSPKKLVLGVSGSPRSTMDLTLTFVARDSEPSTNSANVTHVYTLQSRSSMYSYVTNPQISTLTGYYLPSVDLEQE